MMKRKEAKDPLRENMVGNRINLPMPRPTPQDMWRLLLSTVRYSLGRRSIAVSSVPELVLRYKSYLQIFQIEQIRDEVQKELELHYRMKEEGREKWLGDDCDVQTWKALVIVLTDIIRDTDAGKDTGVITD